MRSGFLWLTADVRRLLLAVVVTVTIVVVGVSNTTHDPGPTDAGAPIERADPTVEPTESTSATPEPAQRDRADIRHAARGYLVAFFDPEPTNAQWRARTDRHSTPALANLNAGVPRTVVPDITIRKIKVSDVKSDYAEVVARMTDGYVLDVAVERHGGRWLVNEVAPR